MDISRFELLSPIDHRYYFSNVALFKKLQLYLSEKAAVQYYIQVELSLLKTIAPYLKLSKTDIKKAFEVVKKITPKEIHIEEKKTQHNIKAVVNVIKKHVPKSIAPYIHLGATSFDITDTAWSMRLRDVSRIIIIPLLQDVQRRLIRIAEKHMSVVQIGRTHGQYALPITIGHSFAEYVSRLGNSIQEINRRVLLLTGKLSGAVGAYNALFLIVKDDALRIEKAHLKNLNLIPAEYSSQICAPEPVLRLLLEYNTAFGILANLADDLRNLQRSEISEVYEFFDKEQVGSSTMPQKRNPWNSEHVKSLYKVFSPRVISFYMDQISEHQRDLTNSASLRFIVDYLVGFSAAIARTESILSRLTIDKKNIQKNIMNAGEGIFTEAIYVILALEGISNGYEMIKKMFVESATKGVSMIEMLKKNKKIWEAIEKRLAILSLPPIKDFFKNPKYYSGLSIKRSTLIVRKHKSFLKKENERKYV